MPNLVSQANKAFHANIQYALSALTKVHWKVYEHPSKGELVRLYTLFPPLKLKSKLSQDLFKLSAHVHTEVIKSDGSKKRVQTTEYIYQIADACDGKALFEFHWHPNKLDRNTLEPAKLGATDRTPFGRPHAHVRAHDKRFIDLNKRHIPTGRVAFEDVIFFLLDDCAVKPARADWKAVLDKTSKDLEKNMSW